MSTESSALFSLARSKLHLSVGSKDSCSLHRWVLLKNSIVHSPTLTSSSTAVSDPNNSVYSLDDGDDEDLGDEISTDEVDSFMFPDAGKLVDNHATDVNASEAEWLNSLLETLGDDDDDYFSADSDVQVSTLPADDDEDLSLSPMCSPMSSSDDLPSQPAYYPPPIIVSYPVPYPPFHPPLIHSYEFDPVFDSSLASLPSPYDDPLPYQDLDDAEDLSVPDIIEDTSDDESDTPTTPFIGRSSSSLSLTEAASFSSLPAERSRLRHVVPHVYIDTDDSYFYPFETDPLPFPDQHHHPSYNTYQEC